jgi:hypothetical protein
MRFVVFIAMTIVLTFFWLWAPCGLVCRSQSSLRPDWPFPSDFYFLPSSITPLSPNFVTSALKMEIACFSESFVSTRQSTQRLNPKEHRQVLPWLAPTLSLISQCVVEGVLKHDMRSIPRISDVSVTCQFRISAVRAVSDTETSSHVF